MKNKWLLQEKKKEERENPSLVYKHACLSSSHCIATGGERTGHGVLMQYYCYNNPFLLQKPNFTFRIIRINLDIKNLVKYYFKKAIYRTLLSPLGVS